MGKEGKENRGQRSAVRMAAERQLLHAWKLGLFHPRTNEWMEFEAPLPADFIGWLHIEPDRMRHSKSVS